MCAGGGDYGCTGVTGAQYIAPYGLEQAGGLSVGPGEEAGYGGTLSETAVTDALSPASSQAAQDGRSTPDVAQALHGSTLPAARSPP